MMNAPRHVSTTSRLDQVEQEDVDAAVNAADFAYFIPWALSKLSTNVAVDISRVKAVESIFEKKGKKSAKESLDKKEEISASHISFAPVLDVDNRSVVKIAAIYHGENLVHFKIHKTSQIPRHLIFIIGLVIRFYPHLYKIDLHSGVDKYTIHELCKFLPKSRITELSFDNNFVREANYELVLDSCKELKVLSLSRCQLGDEVVKRIAEKLEEPHPAASKLNVLNLSSNKLTDVSGKALAKMLRTNRHLYYLNISDNMITDIGGLAILTVFRAFPLTLEEIAMMKTKRLNYLKRRQIVLDSYMQSMKEKEYEWRRKSLKKSPFARSKEDKATMVNTANITSESKYDHKTDGLYQKAVEMTNSQIGVFSDLFRSGTFPIDGFLHSNGNNTLAYLNMAYNSLTYPSLRSLLNTLIYQKDLARIPKGLINVCVEGNNLPVLCREMWDIDNLLEKGLAPLDKGYGKKKAGKVGSK